MMTECHVLLWGHFDLDFDFVSIITLLGTYLLYYWLRLGMAKCHVSVFESLGP